MGATSSTISGPIAARAVIAGRIAARWAAALLALPGPPGCASEEGTPDRGSDADARDALDADDAGGEAETAECRLEVTDVGTSGVPPAAAAIAGTWAQLHVVSHMSNFPGYDAVASVSQMWQLVEATADAAGLLTLTETMCRLVVDTPDLPVDTILPDAFLAGLVPTVRHAAPAAASPGSPFSSDTMIDVRGARLSDRACEELPYAPEDPRVLDQDGDGHPGMTLDFTGLVNVEIYVVQRWTSTFVDGTVESADRIAGHVFSQSEQQALDATNIVFDPADPDPEEFGSWPDPDPEHSYFEMVRLPAGSSCPDVLAAGLEPRPY